MNAPESATGPENTAPWRRLPVPVTAAHTKVGVEVRAGDGWFGWKEEAPFDGIVTRRLMEVGEFASPGRAVIAVHDPASLRAVGSLPQFVLPATAKVDRATIDVPSAGKAFAVTRVTVLPAADPRLLSTQGLHLFGLPRRDLAPVVLTDAHGPVAFYVAPYAEPALVLKIPATPSVTSSFSGQPVWVRRSWSALCPNSCLAAKTI